MLCGCCGCDCAAQADDGFGGFNDEPASSKPAAADSEAGFGGFGGDDIDGFGEDTGTSVKKAPSDDFGGFGDAAKAVKTKKQQKTKTSLCCCGASTVERGVHAWRLVQCAALDVPHSTMGSLAHAVGHVASFYITRVCTLGWFF